MDEQELFFQIRKMEEQIKKQDERLREVERKISSSWNPDVIEPQESIFAATPPPLLSSSRYSVFVSYSHKDERWLKMLRRHFASLINQKKIHLWSDDQIPVGDKRKEKLQHAVCCAKVALLLVTADFLASDFIANYELPLLIDAAEQKELTILWIAVGYCDHTETKLVDYQPFNNLEKPLQALKKPQQEKLWMDVCKCIKDKI